jgi:EmrB/QacA subfamily drug resistance transporter
MRPPCDEAVIRARPAAVPAGGESRRVQSLALLAAVLGSAMVFIDGTIVNVALPAMQRTLQASVVQAQWVVEAYALLLGPLMLVGGSLGDHLGRRRVFAAGTALFAAASMWCGLAPDAGQLIAARALQGVGGALLAPSSLALISAVFPEHQRGRAIGTWSAWTGVTAALGPVLGGSLVDRLSWRWAFFINVPVALAVLALLRAVPERSPAGDRAALDIAGAALVTTGLGGVVFGLIESARFGFGHPAVLGSLLLGSAALGAFAAVERRVAEPLVPFALFRTRAFAAANVLTFLLYGALAVVLFFLPFALIDVHGYSATAAGAALLPFIGLVFLLSAEAGRIVDRWGPRPPLVLGPSLAALGFALMARPGAGGGYLTTFFPAVLALGLGMALTIAPLTTTVLNAVEPSRAGLASGINNAVSRVAGLIAIAGLGVVMLDIFGHRLHARLSGLSLPPGLQAAIEAQRTRLGAIEIPPGMPADLRAAAAAAVREAFVDAFRPVALAAAALALASAATAWAWLDRGPARAPVRR